MVEYETKFGKAQMFRDEGSRSALVMVEPLPIPPLAASQELLPEETMRLRVNTVFCVISLASSLVGWSQERSLDGAPVMMSRNLEGPSNEDHVAGHEVGAASGLEASTWSTNGLSGAIARSRTDNRRYFFLNGVATGMAVFDVEMTQRCIADHRCREANPVMPSSQVGQLSVNFALAAYGAWWSYRLKKQHSKVWWIFPTTGIAVHSAGVATGFEHQ
jgi:hypothetical protein